MGGFKRTDIADVIVYVPRRFEDERGFFSETFNRATFLEQGIDVDWVQDNHSMSRARHTLRGLHFQVPPFAQPKLLRVARGAVLDVVVDLRGDSPTRGRWVAERLSAEGGEQIFVPAGFAHGFLTLEPDTEVLYKVGAPYSREHERGLRFDDPALGIDWGVEPGAVHANARDRAFPTLAELEDFF